MQLLLTAKIGNFENSTSYGWIRPNKKNMVLDVSVKNPSKLTINEYIIIEGFILLIKIYLKYYINLINQPIY